MPLMQDIAVPLKSEPDDNLLPIAHPQPQHHQNYQVSSKIQLLECLKIPLARAKC